MNNEGKYIYAIINAKEPQEPARRPVRRSFSEGGSLGEGGFESIGIGDRGDKVYTVHYKDLAAVVSSSPIVKYPVSREHTMAHQGVLEEVMKRFALLPVRFCTIAEHEEDIKKKVLKARYREFKNLLDEMKDKVELGVRTIWTNMEGIFAEVVEENQSIKQLKERVAKTTSPSKKRAGMMRVGEMVKEALEEKKEKEARELLAVLKPLSVDFREKKVYGDRNIANFVFLVKKANERDFDKKIEELVEKYKPRKKIKYVGPVPPCNFVEIVVTWSR